MPGGYRSDIDGLRAVAVLAVIAFHVAPGRVPGGFIGVDVFFVISGFLISAIIVRELDEGRFSFLTFYRRRIRRIFPALILVLASAFAVAWLLLPDRDFQRFGLHLAASAGFIPNFAFWREGGYFDVGPYSKPLLHLWSLGVEEQYYALWPLFLFLCWRARAGLALPIALAAAASFALNLYQCGSDPVGAFYSPLTRFWELLLGAVPALLDRRGFALAPRTAGLASLAGLAGIAGGLALIHAGRAFPGWWALLPTVGTLLIILAGPKAWPNARALALRPLVWIGLISYPLYLWHWPLISFLYIHNLEGLPAPWRLAAASLALPLAWATYVLVERPIRRMRKPPAAPLCGAMAALAAAGLTVWAAHGIPSRRLADDPKRAFLSPYRYLQFDAAAEDLCSFGNPSRGLRRSRLPASCIAAGPAGTWLLWGDSHARALADGLGRALPEGIGLARVTTGGCPPAIPEYTIAGTANLPVCRRANTYALEQVARLRPRLVLLARREDHDKVDWERMARRIRQAGAGRVVLIGPAPQWRWQLPRIVVRYHWPEIPDYVGRDLVPGIMATDREMERRLHASPDIAYISLVAPLCTEAGCRARVPGPGPARLMASDYGHFSPWGSLYVARTILVPALARADSAPSAGR
jgi:peptidoglycan/LPS O-acetylase OafA/YrhL